MLGEGVGGAQRGLVGCFGPVGLPRGMKKEEGREWGKEESVAVAQRGNMEEEEEEEDALKGDQEKRTKKDPLTQYVLPVH